MNPAGNQTPFAHGAPASTGVAIGVAALDPERIAALMQSGKPIILFRENAETSDIGALCEAAALVTAVPGEGSGINAVTDPSRALPTRIPRFHPGLCPYPSLSVDSESAT